MDKFTVDVTHGQKCCFDFFYPMYAVITSSNEGSIPRISTETESTLQDPGHWNWLVEKTVDVLFNTDFNLYDFVVWPQHVYVFILKRYIVLIKYVYSQQDCEVSE